MNNINNYYPENFYNDYEGLELYIKSGNRTRHCDIVYGIIWKNIQNQQNNNNQQIHDSNEIRNLKEEIKNLCYWFWQDIDLVNRVFENEEDIVSAVEFALNEIGISISQLDCYMPFKVKITEKIKEYNLLRFQQQNKNFAPRHNINNDQQGNIKQQWDQNRKDSGAHYEDFNKVAQSNHIQQQIFQNNRNVIHQNNQKEQQFPIPFHANSIIDKPVYYCVRNKRIIYITEKHTFYVDMYNDDNKTIARKNTDRFKKLFVYLNKHEDNPYQCDFFTKAKSAYNNQTYQTSVEMNIDDYGWLFDEMTYIGQRFPLEKS